MSNNNGEKSLESWLWDAACVIRGERDAAKYKDYILPLVFVKRLCDVFDDEINRIAKQVGNRTKALKLIEKDHKLVRFYLPLRAKDPEKDDAWSVIRTLTNKVGEQMTSLMRDIAKYNPRIQGIIDRIDFNATTHGQRDISEESLIKLIEKISQKRLGLKDVEPDIIGRSYEYLIRKFAEDSGQSAGEFYTPREVGMTIARILDPQPAMEVYDNCCGSAGLLIKCQLVLKAKMEHEKQRRFAPLHLYGQEFNPSTWAMANMNMTIHDMEGKIEIGDTMKNPKFKDGNKLKKFDLVATNPMWNQDSFTKKDYENDEFDRFKAGIPPIDTADWGWMQHILASLKERGKAAIVLGTGATARGSGSNKITGEKKIRKYFIDNDYIESIVLLPFNLFYNTDAFGAIFILNKKKSLNKKGKILFINASKEFVKGKPKNILTEEGGNKIVDAYKSWKEIDGFSRIVEKNEIMKNDYSVSPSKYVLQLIEHQARDVKQVIKEYRNILSEEEEIDRNIKKIIDKNETKKETHTIHTCFGKISAAWEMKPLGDFVKEYKARASSGNYEVMSCSKIYGIILQREKFNNTIASKNKSRYKIVKPNMFVYDPMLVWDGSIGRNHYNFNGIVSPAYSVFEVDDSKINLDYLEYILRADFILPFYISISEGTNPRRRKAKFKDFQKLEIPVAPDSIQKMVHHLTREKRLLESKLKNIEELKDACIKVSMKHSLR